MVVCSPNIQSGAETVYEILSRLIASGTNNFTIAAIPSPAYFGGVDHRYRSWPAVVWRLVDRGDVRVRHSDMGGAELFGSTIIAADPWQIRTVLMADTEENTAAAGKE